MYPKMNLSTFAQLLIHIVKDKNKQCLDLSQKRVIIFEKRKKS